MTATPVRPWHRSLAARMPRSLRRAVLRVEAEIEDRVREFARSLPAAARVLDAGSGEGQHAEHFAHCRYIGVDLAVGEASWDYSRLDARADLARLPFPDRCFAAALNIVVLEHVPDPAGVLAELARVLQPGGRLLLVAPQEWCVHQAPHDYYRYTRYGLELLARAAGFRSIRIEPIGGFFTLLGRRLLDSILYFQGGWRWILFLPVALAAGPTGLVLPWLDFLDGNKDATLAYTCLAER
jgi:SAM-dependent methyltransferase